MSQSSRKSPKQGGGPSAGAAVAGDDASLALQRVSVESPPSSCVSSESDEEAAKPMVVVGCPQCLMYVMLSEEADQPKCPRCKSPVLLHFLQCDSNSNNNSSKNKTNKS